ADLFEHPEAHGATVLYQAWLSEDGGRLHLKRNLGMLIEVDEATPIDVPDGFLWMSLYQIKACLQDNAWVNPHVRGIIAHL
ncbi:MAG: NDP-hexose 2,3-dehydratase family protein, partial [Deltaproteobacteria bacterium]|nr:NDP-hexose 2,3-dehydratase family protein [Deltaproteobacteria bacterium]